MKLVTSKQNKFSGSIIKGFGVSHGGETFLYFNVYYLFMPFEQLVSLYLLY